MTVLSPPQRRALRAKAHHLHPVVTIGQHGLTPGVLHEIDVNLRAHELIKVRVFNDDRVRREAMLERICAELDAAAVQHLGKLLIIWRPAPEASLPAQRPAQGDHVAEAPTRRAGRRGIPQGTRAAGAVALAERDRGSRVAEVGARTRAKAGFRIAGSPASRGQAADAYRPGMRPSEPKRGLLQSRGESATATMAKSKPQARRPRTPMARVPERPPRTGPRTSTPGPKSVTGKRRRHRGGSA